jgi:hypothetical protein
MAPQPKTSLIASAIPCEAGRLKPKQRRQPEAQLDTSKNLAFCAEI